MAEALGGIKSLPTVEVIPPRYKDIPGCEGYQVGEDGSVWSCRIPAHPEGALGGTWHRLRGERNPRGYVRVRFGDCGGRRPRFWVHRLVLEAFVGPRPPGAECCHDDRNPGNNRVGNLRWGTKADNAADQARHGTRIRGARASFPRKLSAADVRRIRAENAAGTSQGKLARRYGINQSIVSRIVHRQSWVHVE